MKNNGLAELERDNILIPLREEKVDVDNIHKVMYNLATQWKKRNCVSQKFKF